MTPPVRILHLEDNAREAALIRDRIEAEGLACEIVWVDTKDGFEAALGRTAFDIILCDYNLPGYDGISAMNVARERHPDTPVIVVSGSSSPEDAVAWLRQGASDYLVKERLERLVPALRQALATSEARLNRDRAEAKLVASEARLRLIVESNMAGILFWDTSGAITEANSAFLSLVGFTQDDVAAGRVDWAEMTPPEYRPLDETALREIATAGACKPFEKEYIRKDGSRVPVMIGGASLPPEPAHGGVAFVVDISERKRMELALRLSERTLSTLVGNLPGMVYRCLNDPDWTMTFVGGSCKELTGYESSDLEHNRAVSYASLVHPDDREWLWAKCQASLDAHEPCRTEYRIVTKDGETRWVQERASGVYHDDGTLLNIEGLVQDITERKRAEDDLQASLRDKEALLKEVHHRVKNNLQVITSLLRLETSRCGEPAARTVLKEMQGRVQSMALLHETLYRSGVFASVDLGAYLRQLVTHSVSAMSAQPGSIQIDLDLVPVRVAMDQALPCGLLVNELISNCMKHAFPEGRRGEIRVELQPIDDGSQLRLRVSDTGVGLPEDFEARRGRSLGLQLVSDLTKQLGGRLEIGPAPRAVFTVTFTAGEARE